MNGVEPEKGRILVPFDLREQVLEPLDRLEHGLADLTSSFNEHLSVVEDSMKNRMEPLAIWVEHAIERDRIRDARMKQLWLGAKWAIGTAATLAGIILGSRGL